jgi:hypothetical protein
MRGRRAGSRLCTVCCGCGKDRGLAMDRSAVAAAAAAARRRPVRRARAAAPPSRADGSHAEWDTQQRPEGAGVPHEQTGPAEDSAHAAAEQQQQHRQEGGGESARRRKQQQQEQLPRTGCARGRDVAVERPAPCVLRLREAGTGSRVGSLLLSPRPATSWRYSRGGSWRRSLAR